MIIWLVLSRGSFAALEWHFQPIFLACLTSSLHIKLDKVFVHAASSVFRGNKLFRIASET